MRLERSFDPTLIKELVVEKLGIPAHRVRTLEQLLPLTVQRPGHENPDKISVVVGGNRLGPVEIQDLFLFLKKKSLNALSSPRNGTRRTLHNQKQIKARPIDDSPRTVSITILSANVESGHAFHESSGR